MRIASDKIKKKYKRQKFRGVLKKVNKIAVDWLRDAGYLYTDDLKTIDYNNDTSINNLEDINIDNLNNIELKKASRKIKSTTDIDDNISPKKIRVSTSYCRNKNAQIAAKNILQKYKNISWKKTPLPFNINDVADAETIDFNKDTNIGNVSSSKSLQIAAKKLLISIKN